MQLLSCIFLLLFWNMIFWCRVMVSRIFVPVSMAWGSHCFTALHVSGFHFYIFTSGTVSTVGKNLQNGGEYMKLISGSTGAHSLTVPFLNIILAPIFLFLFNFECLSAVLSLFLHCSISCRFSRAQTRMSASLHSAVHQLGWAAILRDGCTFLSCLKLTAGAPLLREVTNAWGNEDHPAEWRPPPPAKGALMLNPRLITAPSTSGFTEMISWHVFWNSINIWTPVIPTSDLRWSTTGCRYIFWIFSSLRSMDIYLSTDLYCKPTDRNSLLRADSFHPTPLKKGLTISQFYRMFRICKSDVRYCMNSRPKTLLYILRTEGIEMIGSVLPKVAEKSGQLGIQTTFGNSTHVMRHWLFTICWSF